MQDLMNASELADFLGISKRTVRTWGTTGKLPQSIRIGDRAVRWSRDECEEWVKAGAPEREAWEAMKSDKSEQVSSKKTKKTH